ncbi:MULTISPECIES: hypothetical protein [Actinopolyspora]|uniref:Asp23 family, cell envelope-related function n=1 Tax=Actinopolyspora saharensis TaxID=995062 RepID=A0A1H0Y0A6_9ACTN|nr:MULTISPECIES: hypothetical protein [Actinopolyspora]NHD17450.1 hypothetical protein [Actinopolyspora sp. BKK2]NHE76817.1 hypothetical protein [Actinopolyspora sp. BKK1]SDQ08553.1 hypothetical protein SAMN04489718_0140 [Actinopolyspora saharensis]
MNSGNADDLRGAHAERIAEAVLGHPCVVRLDGGEHGTVATYLPGRRVTGVRVDPDGVGTAEVCVVLRLLRPVPELVDEIRAGLREVVGDSPVDVTVADVLTPDEPEEPPRTAGDRGELTE